MVGQLNQKADALSEPIERELKRRMPPYVSVQATVQFEEGSLVMVGTIALLSWAGGIVFDAAKLEIEQQLSNLVKAGVQRVVNRFLTVEGFSQAVRPMKMHVTPLTPSSPAALFAHPQSASQATNPGQPSPPAPAFAFPAVPPAYRWLFGTTAFLFLVQIALIFGQFFEVHPR